MKKYEKAILWIALTQGALFFVLYRAHPSPKMVLDQAPEPLKISSLKLIGDEKELSGNRHALYTLVEFGDYQCPPCAQSSSQIKLLMSRYPEFLRFRFRHYPLEMHPYAMNCAIAAEKARTFGRFWDVHDQFYALKTNIAPDEVTKLLNRMHLNINHLSIQQQKAAKRRVQEDMKIADLIDLNGTPTFLLCCPDGRVLKLSSLSQAEYFLK